MKNITFLSTLLATTFLSGNALAETTYETCTNCQSCGTNCKYEYVGNALQIYGPTDGTSTGSIADDTFYGQRMQRGITDVVISGGITSVGNWAFASAYNGHITSLTLSDSITSVGNNAFAGLSGITNLTLPKNLSSIGSVAFAELSGLTSLVIPDTVTTIPAQAFYNCTGIEKLTIPDSVTSIGGLAFYGVSSLTELTIPDSVTSIGDNAFYGMSSLTTLNIPDTISEGLNLAAMIDNGTYADAVSQYEWAKEEYEWLLEDGLSEEEAREWSWIDYTKQELDAAAEALRNHVASLTINCSGNVDVCKQNILNALPQSYKDALGDLEPFIFAGASYKQKNPDGSVAYYTGDGKLKTIRGKKIYTVQEAEEVTKNGDKFHVYLTYK